VLEMLAAIRPAGQDFPVLLHIVGATIVFGALLASATSLALARGEIRLLRLGYFSLLFVALPGMALMWGAGQWIYHKQGWNKLPSNVKDVDWLTIGFVVGDYGGPQRLVVGTVFRPGRPLRLAMQACVDQSEMPRLWRIYELCAPVRPSTRSGSR